MVHMVQEQVAHWHQIVKEGDKQALQDLLADDVVFYSPVIFPPQHGKMLAFMYLSAAFEVLTNEHFQYVGEYYSDDGAVLEFTTQIDGITVEGIDRILFGTDGKITDFKVMVRPKKAMDKLQEMMAAMLQTMGPKA